MEAIFGSYRKTLFFNTEQGQHAFFFKPTAGTCEGRVDPRFGTVKCVGKHYLTQPGMPLYLVGEWKRTQNGEEFHFMEASEWCGGPDMAAEFMRELKKQGALSASPKAIQKLAKFAGANLFAAAMTPGVEDAAAAETGVDIVDASQAFAKIRSLVSEMNLCKTVARHGGTYEHAMKIKRKFPEEATRVLAEEPYRVLEEAAVPFDLIDSIALSNGVEPLSLERLRALALWAVRKDTGAGNVFMRIDSIFKIVSKKRGEVPYTAIAAALADHPYLMKDPAREDVYYEKRLYEDEVQAAKGVARLLTTAIPLPWRPDLVDEVEKENGRPFGSQQKSAFRLLTSTGLKILTGDPGTGKTTTLNSLLRYLEKVWQAAFGRKPRFALCAPSGRAAQRMKETTGRNAMTVHKTLGVMPYGTSEYYKNANDPIDADVIVVDEISMLDLSTFRKLVEAIRSGCLLILVGDVNQLQSVGPGSVLADLGACGCVDSCHLTEVFRQAEDSLININAKKVIGGDPGLLEGADFKIVRTSSPEESAAAMKEEVARMTRECGDPDDVQVLAPMRKGACGIYQGNQTLQEQINPPKKGPSVWHGRTNYRVGDRVIMMSNNYALNYFNGDVGYVKEIGESSMKIEIGEETIVLPREQYGDMELAYDVTIHKSQGSEYGHLAIVLQGAAKNMLNRNLLYTGITRGKKEVVLIAEEGTIEKSCATVNVGKRNSALAERIVKELEARGWR